MMIRKWFHWPKGLSAFTSGSFPGEPSRLFHNPPNPLSAARGNFAVSVEKAGRFGFAPSRASEREKDP